MLPSRAIKLISEYSRPITCSNWRKSKPVITPFRLYSIIRKRRRNILKYRPIYFMVLYNIEDTDWYYTFNYIKQYGVETYDHKHFFEYGDKYHPNNVQAIDGIPEAIIQNHFYYK